MAPVGTDAAGVTRREAEVLEALAERLTNAEIAARLYRSERTVESHVSSLLRKLGAANRLELAAIAKAAHQLDGGSPSGADRTPLPAPIGLLADPASYVGRGVERRTLRDLWTRAAAGTVLVGVVSGEAGIGKSRLVAELAAEVHADGGRVLLGACFEDAQLPYEPFARAIADDLATIRDEELRRRTAGVADQLVRLLPEISQRLGVARPGTAEPLATQVAMFDAIRTYLVRTADTAPTLVVIEDVHWGTSTTSGTVRHLGRVSGHAPLLVLMTTRDVAPDVSGTLRSLLADLARLPAATQISLVGLPAADVAQLLAQAGHGHDTDAAAVAATTGGNPLFVQEVAGSGSLGSLRGLLDRRFALLDATDRDVVDLAAVIGTELDADLLATASGRPLTAVLEALERAGSAGLIAATPGHPGRFAWVHALFRAARYDDLPRSQRLPLHRDIARALTGRAGDDRVIPELARHAAAAMPLTAPREAYELAKRAGAIAERAFAVDEAAEHYQSALDATDRFDAPDPHARLETLIRLGEALNGAGRGEYFDVLMEAAALARQLDDAQGLAEVAWSISAYGSPRNSTDHGVMELCAEALERLGPEHLVARARTLTAYAYDMCFVDPEGAFAMVTDALDIARELGDPETLGHALLGYRLAARTPDNAQARHPIADEVIALGRATGNETFVVVGLSNRAWSHREQGELQECAVALDEARALIRNRPVPPTYLAALILFDSNQQLLAGDLGAAEAAAEKVLDLATAGFDPTLWYGPAMMVIRHYQGRLHELTPLIEVTAAMPGLGPTFQAALCPALARSGRRDAASAMLDRLVDEAFGSVPANMLWLGAMTGFAEAIELVGHASAGRMLGPLLAPYAGRIADLPQTVVAPIDLALAQCALAAGDAATAEHAAARAVRASRDRGTPLFLGRELLRLAAARVAAGASPSDRGVAPLVAEALEVADSTGAKLIQDDATHLGLT